MTRGRRLMQSAAGVLLAAALLGISGAPAWAGDACSGTYSTSVMQRVPLPMTLTFMQTGENRKLAQRFLDGLRSEGGQVDPASPLRLNLVFTITTPAAGPMQGQSYNNFSWADQNGQFADISAGIVNVTAQVMDITSYAYVWVASAQCIVKVRDGGAVAAELGALIGRTLGRDEPSGKF
jgi:hypothetical protein